MKILNIIFRVLLVLLLISPVLGSLGIFPAPTRDLYNTDIAYEFINMLLLTKYVTYTISIVFLICIVLTAMNKMAIVALLLAPITLNIFFFHLFLDGGMFTAGAIMANVLAIINAYFLWTSREQYKTLWSGASKTLLQSHS